MPRQDYIPRRNADLGPYASNLSGIVSSNPEILGLSASVADTLAGLVGEWLVRFNEAQADSTRGKATVYAAKVAARALRDYIRVVSAMVHATSSVTDQQLVDLGLTVRTGRRVSVPVPEDAPLVRVTGVVGNTVEIQARDPRRPDSRARPKDASGMTVMTHVGETYPPGTKGWDLQFNSSRMKVKITFPDQSPGTRVWIAVRFYNGKGEAGRSSEPISTRIQFGGGLAESA